MIDNLENEIWLPIIGYEDLYEISNMGRVKSIDRYVTNNSHGGIMFKVGRILKFGYNNKTGYYYINLSYIFLFK